MPSLPMNGEKWPLGIDKLAEFKKQFQMATYQELNV